MAQNEQVLDGVPVFGHARLINEFSVGHTASDAPLGQENGPPYGSYTTQRTFQSRRAATCSMVGEWYERAFRRLGWHRAAASGVVGAGYFRGHAFVYFDCNSRANGIGFSLSADYNER
ncbi:MAG TPA: hypothetical protein VJ716_03675 [Gaiellaceae bacterium]|nr:hypothetical protein [Gaiellaceae bacterium]